jgi:hypothetical protein
LRAVSTKDHLAAMVGELDRLVVDDPQV